MDIQSELERVFCHCEGEDGPLEEKLERLRHAPKRLLDQYLFHVIGRSSMPLLKLFLELGADREASSKQGMSPLHYACQCGELEMAQYLVKSGALCFSVCDRGFNALIYAVLGLSLPMVEWACRLGCDPNHQTVGGFTPLHAAVAQPDKGEREGEICAILEFLIKEGARIDRRMRPMPGEIAEASHLPEAAKILWSQTPEQPSFHDSPIYLGIPVEVYSLLARGADINEKDSTGMTPLSRAAMGELLRRPSS